MEYEATRRVETSARTFAIIERLGQTDRMGVSALADELGMSKGIVHNHLSTLRELGYVRKVSDEYALSPKLLTVGFGAWSNARLNQFASELAAELSRGQDVGVVCCQRAGDECVVIGAHGIPQSLNVAAGTTLPLRGSLVGAVLCVAIPSEDAEELAPDYDIDNIREVLSTGRNAVGPLSTDMSETCVAVPILDETGACLGSVGAVAPEGVTDQRLRAIQEAMASLRDNVERRLESGWTGERSFATEKHEWIN